MDIGTLHGSIELDDNTAPAYKSAADGAKGLTQALEDAVKKASEALSTASEKAFAAFGTAGQDASKTVLQLAKEDLTFAQNAVKKFADSGVADFRALRTASSDAVSGLKPAATEAITAVSALGSSATGTAGAVGAITPAAAGAAEALGGITIATAPLMALFSAIVLEAALVVGAILGIGQALISLGTYGSQINDVSGAFNKLTGDIKVADENLKIMREGTQGLIGDTKLMGEASELMRAGLKLTASEYATVTKAATVLADEGLGSVEKNLNMVTTALIKGKSPALDEAIGKVNLAKAEKDYANAMGGSAIALTQTGKLEAHRLAYMAALEEHVKYATVQELDFAESIKAGWVALENWGAKLASAVASSPVVMKAVSDIREAFEKAFGSMDELIPRIVAFFDTYAALVGEYAPKLIAAMKSVFDWFAKWEPVIIGVGIALITFWKIQIGWAGVLIEKLDEMLAKFKEIKDHMPSPSKVLDLVTNPGSFGARTAQDLANLPNQVPSLTEDALAAARARAGGVWQPPPLALAIPSKGKDVQGKLAPLPDLTAPSAAVQKWMDLLSGLADKNTLTEVRAGIAGIGLEIDKLDLWPAREGDAAVEKFVKLGKTLSELRDKGLKLSDSEGVLASRYEMLALTAKKYTDVLPQLIKYSTAWDAVLKDKAARDEVVKWMDRVIDKFPRVTDLLRIGINVDWDPLGTAAEKAGYRTEAAMKSATAAAKQLYEDMLKSGRFTAGELDKAWQDWRDKQFELFKSLHPEWERLNNQLRQFGQAMMELGSIIPGTIGVMVTGVGKLSMAWAKARELAEQYRYATTGQRAGAAIGIGASGASDMWQASSPSAGGSGARIGGAVLSGAATGAMIGSVIPVIGTIIGAVIGAVVGLVIAGSRIIAEKMRDGRKAVVDFANSFDESMTDTIDGFTALHTKLEVLGESGEAMWQSLMNVSAGDKEGAEAAIEKVKIALEAVDKATKQYGMTWKDLDAPQKRMEELYRSGNNLAGMFEILKRSGYSVSAITRQMSGDLNQYIIDTMDAGMKFPPAMAPILKTLIETKQISEEAAAALLGIGTKAVPSIAAIEEAASRYGLTLADLGESVRKIQMDEQVEQIVSDFELLTLAGVPFNLIMKDTTKMVTDAGDDFSKMSKSAQEAYLAAGGTLTEVTTSMRDQIQKLILDSINLGKPLDESLKPIVQKLIDAGGDKGLVDQFGNALTDVSKLEWKKPLSESIDELITKLGELIDSFTGPGGLYEAITGLPGVKPPTTPTRPPGESTGGGAQPRTPTSTTPGPGSGTTPAETRPGVQSQTVTVELDGDVITRKVVDGMPDVLRVRGV